MPKQMTRMSRKDRRAAAARSARQHSPKAAGSGGPVLNDPTVILTSRDQLIEAQKARRAGDLRRAQKICESLVKAYPDYVAALHLLGLVYVDQGDNEKALPCLIRATMLNPQEWTILTTLGQVYIDLGAAEQAAVTLKQGLAIKYDVSETHYTLGHVWYKQREYEEAVRSFSEAIRFNPENSSAMLWLGKVYTHLGDLEKASEAFADAHRVNPDAIGPLMELAQLPRQFAPFDVIAAIEQLTDEPADSRDDDDIRIAFARANAHDRSGDHEKAWEELVKANEPLHQRYRSLLAEYVSSRPFRQSIAESYSPSSRPIRSPDNAPVSLFILGVSRSGKTTVERLIALLPQVRRGYENRIIERSVRRASQTAGILTLQNLPELPPQLGEIFARCYHEELAERAGDARVFTNTHPGQISDVGRLADWIEGARFLFVKRDRMDTAMRILMKHYQSDTNPYAYDLETALGEIDWYHNMMDLWQERLPERSMTLRYEEVVADPAGCLAAAAGFCGISADLPESPSVGDDRSVAEAYGAFLGNSGPQ